MQIIIVGCGSVGRVLIEQLSREDHNITVIDQVAEAVQDVVDEYDVMGVVGNAASYSTMKDAGIEGADLMIAVTSADELNLLSCLIARKAGHCSTIARVRNPVYKQEVSYIKEELGLSMVTNPEEAAAGEAVRLLKFPSARKVETFARGRAEMVTIAIEEDSRLIGKPLSQLRQEYKSDVLFAVVVRDGEALIPDGQFVPKAHDDVTLIGKSKDMVSLFRKLKLETARVHSTIIAGGGSVSYYLAQQLLTLGVDVRIFERDNARCKELSNILKDALIINAQATDRELLMEEGLADVESFVALTEHDEANVMLSLYAKSVSKAKRITMLRHEQYGNLLDTLDVGSVIDPRQICAERIVQYVRAMNNTQDSNIEMLYAISEGKAEVLEFKVGEGAPVCGQALMHLNIKKGVLVALIIRFREVIAPDGNSEIQAGDRVIIVTTHSGFHDISDILDRGAA
ncbi:MAG: Trk system potassium transporter TrkA [Lachnospiraceae bacterium]|nr:Trk system potassium transporter TrkA [Lachnospiraceae bacterium]